MGSARTFTIVKGLSVALSAIPSYAQWGFWPGSAERLSATRLASADCNGNGIDDAIDIANCPPGDVSCADCNNNGIPDECDLGLASGFQRTCAWSTFDFGDHCDERGVSCVDPDGYWGAVFDGRYVYFVPQFNGSDGAHGEVLRYDTTDAFATASSWTTFDPGANGVGADPDGYFGAVFDGQYIYFVPSHNGSEYTGEVLRYDTTASFGATSSWTTYDPGANGVGVDADGYAGAVFDGRYVYFTPYHNGTDWHGEVLRFDTIGTFANPTSWETYDPGTNGVGTDPDGFVGAVFDGRFVYFVPYTNSTEFFGEVLRYDTTGGFTIPSSWATNDPGTNGYVGAVFDGRYVYFAPDTNSGEVLRYDTAGAFASAASWDTYDPGANGVGTDPDGYALVVYHRRYVYFVPYHNGSDYHGEVLRYDTNVEFANAASWSTFDPGSNGVGVDPDGYFGAVSDSRYLYFAPYFNGSEFHGEVLRYDTMAGGPNDCNCNAVPNECEPDCDCNGIDDVCDLGCGTPGGVCDVAGCGQGLDCDGDGILDHCEVPQPVCVCVVDGDCDDGLTCTCDRCVGNQCVHVAVTAGDTSCECVGPDIDDLICVLGGFANIVDCPNGDLAPECTGDDVIDLDDLILILAAIAGEPSPCFCGICGRACCQPGGVCTMEGPLHCEEDLGGTPMDLGYCCEATPVCVVAGCR